MSSITHSNPTPTTLGDLLNILINYDINYLKNQLENPSFQKGGKIYKTKSSHQIKKKQDLINSKKKSKKSLKKNKKKITKYKKSRKH